jgi:thioredoxin reductase (NADPH)
MLVRGDALEKSMSHYLIQQIKATPNLEVLLQTELTLAHGEDRLVGITVADASGQTRQLPGRAVFVFIGTAPHSELAAELLVRDASGFIVTGRELLGGEKPLRSWTVKRDPYPLETSVPGIFAVGDVRAGSMKRVASAVGEGANAVALVHQYLRTV